MGAQIDDPGERTTDGHGRTDSGEPVADIVERYLPNPFYARIPRDDRWWRGRAVLLTWTLGFPLEMAWVYGMSRLDGEADVLRERMSRLDDVELVARLEATSEIRGDGIPMAFVDLGDDVESDPPVS